MPSAFSKRRAWVPSRYARSSPDSNGKASRPRSSFNCLTKPCNLATDYELYLPQEVNAVGLQFLDLTAQHALPSPSQWDEKTERLQKARESYQKLSRGGHPLRVALDKLQTLDLVRTIEGHE